MNNKDRFESNGLTQVWAWKEEIHREVAHLPIIDAICHIQAQAGETAKKHPELRRATPSSKHASSEV